MNDLMLTNKAQMTSLEIAELVDKPHREVKRVIVDLVKNGIIQLSKILKVENKQSLSNNRYSDAYLFEGEEGKRDSIVVVARLCPQFMARIVDRWIELEKAAAPRIPQTYAEALRLAADQQEQLEALALENKELKPKAEVHDAIARNPFHRNATQVAQTLGISAIRLNIFLERLDVYNRNCAKRVFKQWFIDKGYGVQKLSNEGFPQALFTAMGQEWITRQYIDHYGK